MASFPKMYFVVSFGLLLTQTASAASLFTKDWYTALRRFGTVIEPSISHTSRNAICSVICKNIYRGEKRANITCRVAPASTPVGPLLFLSPQEGDVLSMATSGSSTWCCTCGAAKGRLAPQKSGPYPRLPNENITTSTLRSAYAFIPNFHSRRLACSVTSSSLDCELPEEPRPQQCDQTAAPSLRSGKDVDQWLDYYIDNYKVVVFAKSTCPFSITAIDVLQSFTSDVCTVMIDGSPFMFDIQEALEKRTGARTVPRVFIGRTSVGGCDDVLDLADKNLLQKMIEQAL